MSRRLFHLALGLAILVGGYRAWHSGRRRAALEAEHARLSAKAGDLSVGDPTRIHLLALPTGDPMSFAWRVHQPAGSIYSVRQTLLGGSSATMGGSVDDFLARVRFFEVDGHLEVYMRYGGSSGQSGLGDPALERLVREHWGELEVDQLGEAGEVVTLAPGETATLLEIAVPDGLADEFARALPPYLADRLPMVFQLVLNPPPGPY